MKRQTALLLLLLITTFASAQKSEKIKGSKIVTIAPKEIKEFATLEISDNLEVYIEKGDKSALNIEADDNLHSAIAVDSSANALRISTTRTIIQHSKLIVRITYTNALTKILIRDKATLNAISKIELDDITIQSFDNSKLYINAVTKSFTLQSDNDSKTELNLKSENAFIQLSKSAELKALITSKDFKCDLYQKSEAIIEGDITSDAIIRLDNYSELTAYNLAIKNAQVITEGYSKCSININKNLELDASGDSKIDLYGEQKIEIKQFIDTAVLSKKAKK